MAGIEGRHVGGLDQGVALEPLLDPALGRGSRPAGEPEDEPQGPEIARPVGVAVADAERLDGRLGQLGDVDLHHPEMVELVAAERAGVVARLLQVALAEGSGVDDQGARGPEVGHVHLEGGRVQRHQYVELVAGRAHPLAAELDLEGGDAEGGADRCADLRRKVREGGEIGAAQGGFLGEAAAGELHAVAAVAGEADDQRAAGRP